MQILNIAGYKFINLGDLTSHRDYFYSALHEKDIKGTILLSEEGININLAGSKPAINEFQAGLKNTLFDNIKFHESYSDSIPFHRLKIKLKKEIITLRQEGISVAENKAPGLKPHELKQWLDEQRDFTLLDTRNQYEINLGTFKNSHTLPINDFCEFPAVASMLKKDKPIVMFCTGGIRCEKAAIYLKNQGFENVYQLEGGILGYFAQIGSAHYDGSCFVFDDRGALDTNLNPIASLSLHHHP